MVLLYCFYATGAPGRPLEGGQRRFATPSVDEFWRQVDLLARAASTPPRRPWASPRTASARRVRTQIRPIHDEAARRELPVHLHVEEQRREIEESLAAYGRTPMAVILEAVEGGTFTAVHCTHTADADMARFLGAGGRVCLCPLTEGNLGDGIPQLVAAHAAGGRLAIGTDSNNRLAMLEEMRWLEYGQRLRGEMRGALAGRRG